jgi:transcriptional regulator with XRE-family HTH domain
MSSWADERRAAFIRLMRERHGIETPTELARLAGVAPTTIRSYWPGRGEAEPQSGSLSSRTEAKIARALGVTVDSLYDEDYGPPPEAARVWVKGYIGAGNTVLNFEAMGENEGFYEVARPPGVAGGVNLVAAEIRGGSMPPWRDGDVVYCEARDHVDIDSVLGEACLVELADGGTVFKDVRRGYEPGTFNLHSWDGRPPMENQRIVRAMPMVSVVRKRQAAL